MNLIETFSAVLQSDTRQQVSLPQQKHADIRDRNIRVYDQVGKRPQVFISLIQEISSSWDEHDDFDQDQLPFFIEVRENLKLLTENFKLIFLDVSVHDKRQDLCWSRSEITIYRIHGSKVQI